MAVKTFSVDEADIRRLQLKFETASKRTPIAAREALEDVGEDLLDKSKAIVPIEEFDLRDSGFYRVEDGPLGPELIVGYDTPYALRQHEELDYRHDPGRQAKYLEEPAITNWPMYAEMLKDSTIRALRDG